MTNSHNDQIENRSEDGYGKSVGYNPLQGWISQNLPRFSKIHWSNGKSTASQQDTFHLKGEFHRIYPFWNCQTSNEEIFTIFLHFCIASLPYLGSDTQKTRSHRTLIGKNKTAFCWLLGVRTLPQRKTQLQRYRRFGSSRNQPRRYHQALNFTSTHGFLTEHLEQAIFLFTDRKLTIVVKPSWCYHEFCILQYVPFLLRPLGKELPWKPE